MKYGNNGALKQNLSNNISGVSGFGKFSFGIQEESEDKELEQD